MGDRELTLRDRLASARIARLATVDRSGAPHLVPITFAVTGDRVITAIDHKPKRSPRLRRLANIAVEPRVSVLADHYEDDWDRLWWVRVDGIASVLAPGVADHQAMSALLADKYPEYLHNPIAGPIIDIRVTVWAGWSAAGG
jgi:PPOX class probable F420-dependent enzyme